MNAACNDLQVLVSLRAVGALEPAEEALVETHLAACPACRAEAARDAELLGIARLPPPTDREYRAIVDVPARAVAVLRRSRARRFASLRIAGVVAAVAAAALMVVAPALLRKPPPEHAAAPAAAAWEEPDLDGIWSDTAVLDLETVAATGDGADAALAALDVGEDG